MSPLIYAVCSPISNTYAVSFFNIELNSLFPFYESDLKFEIKRVKQVVFRPVNQTIEDERSTIDIDEAGLLSVEGIELGLLFPPHPEEKILCTH